jgi:two-component system sensor histidine kinase PilS (NtrC family)
MNSLRRKLLWLIGARAAAITVVLGSAILVQYKLDYNPALSWFQIGPFFALIALTYALTIVWTLTLRFVDRHRWLIDVQLACDALIVSAIVYLTGGVSSYFSTLYTMPIIAASTVQSWRGGLMVSLLSSFMYSGLVIAQYQEVPLPYAPPLVVLPLSRVLFTVGVNVSGFLAVAGLSGYLAEGLRRTGVQLEATSTQLADLQAFNQHVIDSLTSGLATSDMRGGVLTFNRAAESITGIAAADAVGHDVTGVLQLPRVFTDVIAAGDTRAGTLRQEFGFVRGDGRQIEVGLASAPLITPRGEAGFLFTFQDVTELKKQEREARVQQRLAAVGEMAAGIAHEIRNPLASMAGSIQILRDELPLTADQSQLMDIVLRESDRLNDTIRGFLAFARPQRNAMADGDLRLILRDTARLLENNSEVTERHAVVVAEPPDPVIYRADQAQIRQIVWNLATNGLRAMPSGGELRLSIHTTAVEVVLGVQDEGVGIAPEEMDGIFQPFRGGFARGTGLGLSIVHRIASDYGAEVRVTSEKGKGTKVEVALPLTAAEPIALPDSRKGVA